MKKIIAIALSLILVLSLSVTAFAATVDRENGTDASNVTGKYESGATAAELYSVEVAWEGMTSFVYTDAGVRWDPAQHKDVSLEDAEWTGEGTITVTNNSNVKIKATASFNPGDYEGEAYVEFDKALELDVAPEGPNGTSDFITVTPAGTLEQGHNGVFGQVTVTIIKYVPAT